MSRSVLKQLPKTSFQSLVDRKIIEIAVDTEFHGRDTLTVQVAARVGPEDMIVQVYRSEEIRGLPGGFDLEQHWPQSQRASGDWGGRVRLRKLKTITPDLSPVQMLQDLFNIRDLTALSRGKGYRLRAQAGNYLREPKIRLVIVGHYLKADLGRMFGRRFYQSLFTTEPGPFEQNPVTLRREPRLGFTGNAKASYPEVLVVEYVQDHRGELFAIELTMIDTNGPFGPGSLDELCQTFLGQGKIDEISPAEKRDMRILFRDQPARAYSYAIADAVMPLMLLAAMRANHRDICQKFDIEGDQIPEMKSTLGGRGAELIKIMAARGASSSQTLNSPARLADLMRKGSKESFGGECGLSHFGEKTGVVHGGLLFSRTANHQWHEAPGQFRDLDIRACYNRVTQGMNVYFGQPIVLEPGNKPMSLREAVALLE